MQEKKPQEKVLRDALKDVLEACGALAFDMDPKIPWIIDAIEQAEAALASTSEETEMEKLHLMVKALEATERENGRHCFEEGDDRGFRDCIMRANGMGKILDEITTQFLEETGE